jgi:hypothetical protein
VSAIFSESVAIPPSAPSEELAEAAPENVPEQSETQEEVPEEEQKSEEDEPSTKTVDEVAQGREQFLKIYKKEANKVTQSKVD